MESSNLKDDSEGIGTDHGEEVQKKSTMGGLLKCFYHGR